MTPKILAFAGSARTDSWNKKLVRVAAAGARAAGGDVTEIDLRDYPMPLYDGDAEAADGLPEHALALKKLFEAHHGLLIASPEYNSSISPLLKNTIDWVSRPASKDEAPLSGFAGKVAGLMACSPGGLGGLRGLVHIRAILGNIRVIVIPEQRAIGSAHTAFNDDGTMTDDGNQKAIEGIGARVVEVAGALGAGH